MAVFLGTKMITMKRSGSILMMAIWLVACSASNPPQMSTGHLKAPEPQEAAIPAPVTQTASLPRPERRPPTETYTVIVNQVDVRDLLFSMARDAKMNLDIATDIDGKVTMNAIDQTLPRILERISRQVALDYRIKDGVLTIRADKPYIEMYDVDYLNLSRNSSGKVTVSSAIDSTGTSLEGESGSGEGNDSSTSVENQSSNEFWKTLTINIAAIIDEDISAKGDDDLDTSTNIIVNRESGVLAVKATSRQHEQIQMFFDRVLGSAKRQVLIEATIAEVTLSDRYQAGIDWSLVSSDPNVTITQDLLGGNLGQSPFVSLSYADTLGDNPLNATLKALETFGDVKVLSSPKVMALNNQTSILKVVDNEVYFSVSVDPATITNGVVLPATFETEINTVPVGFVMTVTPQIDANDVVTMNVRPTISRIVKTVEDPNPDLANAGVISTVPVIQVREIESVLKVNNGDTAVIGGLMQDQVNKNNTGVPLLSSIPVLGQLFSYVDEEYVKSELVIFIRPVVAHDASLTGDLASYSQYLDIDIQPSSDE